MHLDAAAWVRENVWPTMWLRNHNHIPGTTFECACQRPPSVECQMGRHGSCRHDGRPIRETVVQTHRNRAATFPEPHKHPSPELSGRNDLAWVWLAGPPCRQICNCGCHTGRPEPVLVEMAGGVQLDLFGSA